MAVAVSWIEAVSVTKTTAFDLDCMQTLWLCLGIVPVTVCMGLQS